MPDAVWIIFASTGGLTVLGLVWVGVLLVHRKAFGSFSMKAGPVDVKLAAISRSVEQINRAVNHVPTGEPPMIDRVRRLEPTVGWLVAAVHTIGSHLGVDLGDPPDTAELPTTGGDSDEPQRPLDLTPTLDPQEEPP